jgi:hypothetical protein
MNDLPMEIKSVGDLAAVGRAVGLPVGPRTGAGKRTQAKKEWFVLLEFLRGAIPANIFDLPITVARGRPHDRNGKPLEPDFLVMREASVFALIEITEATDETDQREMTESELSGKLATMPGEFGGRFADGAARPGLVWASDVVDAIKRKDGKVIFQTSAAERHLIVYPNSNSSFLLFDEDDEREAIDNLESEIAKDPTSLARMTNGCRVHVLCKHMVCIDALGSMRLLAIPSVREIG